MSTTAQAVACACGRRFQAPAQLAGKRVKCPACGGAIDVPPLAVNPLDSAGLAMQSLPAAATNPLGSPVRAAAPVGPPMKLPRGVWIGLGVVGGAFVLLLAALLVLWSIGQRLIADNQAKAAQRAAQRVADGQVAAAPVAGPQVYQSPTGRFSVEFPGQPKRELVRSSEPGRLTQSHWEASYDIGQFLQFRGEQFLVIEKSRSKKLADMQIDAGLTQLVNITANIDDGRGRLLSSADISEPGYRGREVTYEYTAKSGGKVSGRYRVLFTEREIISIEWVSAPAKAETPEAKRFFDSFQLKAD